jgi:hypothetical protein
MADLKESYKKGIYQLTNFSNPFVDGNVWAKKKSVYVSRKTNGLLVILKHYEFQINLRLLVTKKYYFKSTKENDARFAILVCNIVF